MRERGRKEGGGGEGGGEKELVELFGYVIHLRDNTYKNTQ